MAQITEDYVSFETAKLLKEKGFDEDIDLWYDENGDTFFKYHYAISRDWRVRQNQQVYQRPTLQMAMKWLREVHNIHIELNPICTGDSNEDLEWHYGWAVRTTIFTDRWKRHDAEHISYEQACNAAIKYCLENLI